MKIPCILTAVIAASPLFGQVVIDATFDGVANDSNNTFSLITNAQGSQGPPQTPASFDPVTGIIDRGTTSFSNAGIVSMTPFDVPNLGASQLILRVEVEATTGDIDANGVFIGLHSADTLWNQAGGIAFGLVIDGDNRGLRRELAPGGNSGTVFRDTAGFGVATLASMNDGFTVVMQIDTVGFTFIVIGLEDENGNAITGGSGTWANNTFDFEDFTSDMRVGVIGQQGGVGGNATTFDLTSILLEENSNPDSDNDGLADLFEDRFFGNNNGLVDASDLTAQTGDGNADSDSLLNSEEETAGTNPNLADTDGDGLDDDVELDGSNNPFEGGFFTDGLPGDSTDPLVADSDGDSLSDFEEVTNDNGSFSDPNRTQTDDDRIRDDLEVGAGTDPNDENSVPAFATVNWSAQIFDEVTDLNTSGSLLFAENYNAGSTTVNTIEFAGAAVVGVDRSTDNLSTELDNATGELYDDEVPELTSLFPFWFDGNGEDSYVISGLTPGESYLIQFAQADDRDDERFIGRYTLLDGSFGGGDTSAPVGATNTAFAGPLNPAILFTGSFVATSPIQQILVSNFLPSGDPNVADTPSGTSLPFMQVRQLGAVTDSTILITDCEFDGGTFTVDFEGLDPNQMYQLSRGSDLLEFGTVVDGPRLPNAATDTFTDSAASDERSFYILQEVVPES